MDEQKFFELRRDVDRVAHVVEEHERKMATVINRQEKHEEKFDASVEKLANSMGNIDKKLDVFIAQVAAKGGVWEKVIQVVPYILFTIFAGWYGYNKDIEQQIKENPPVQVIQKR